VAALQAYKRTCPKGPPPGRVLEEGGGSGERRRCFGARAFKASLGAGTDGGQREFAKRKRKKGVTAETGKRQKPF